MVCLLIGYGSFWDSVLIYSTDRVCRLRGLLPRALLYRTSWFSTQYSAYRNNYIFWSDELRQSLRMSNFNGFGIRTLISSRITRPCRFIHVHTYKHTHTHTHTHVWLLIKPDLLPCVVDIAWDWINNKLYARVSHAVAGEARVAHVTFAVEAVWCVSSIQATMALPRHHPRPPSPLPKDTVIHPSIWVEHIWTCQTVWHTYDLYLWYATTFHVTFLSVYIRTYIRNLWE